MTNYEKKVKAGEATPWNQLDSLMLAVVVEDVIDGKPVTPELKELFQSPEIVDVLDHYYKDDSESLIAFREIIREAK